MSLAVLDLIYQILAPIHLLALFSSFWILWQFHTALSAKLGCKSHLLKWFSSQTNMWHQTKN